ncbi:2-aminoadipate transaminase [Ochlerotatus camptorhynchus]|uniref:2-aminoadipate transaminase n=1 Tax=Ochlerotatus camptorhynchus TaxID=644619 RepID=UPI0031D354BE
MNKRTEIPKRHLFDGSDFNVYDQQLANLSAGAPGPDLLSECSEIFRIATEHRMKFELENNSYLFQYGPTIGTTEFRQTLAEFLSKGYQSDVNKSDLVQTSGATHGLHLILSTLIDLAGVIFVDEVTYMIALETFRQFDTMKIVTVPLREDGPDIGVLSTLINQHKFKLSGNKIFWGVYYTIPTFHNPTGILFSDEINKQLIRLARSSEILIACDDVYNLLYYSSDEANSTGKQHLTPPKRLFAYDIDDIESDGWKGNVISNGSFSKILSPGIRLGWMECPPRCMEVLRNSGVLKSGGAANNYTGGIVTSMIQLGLAQQQLRLYADKYADRLRAACMALNTKLPKKCSFIAPNGGYFLWIRFPEGVDCNDFNQYCMQNFGVLAIAGSRFSSGGSHQNFMRLTFAFHEAELLKASVGKLCLAIEAYLVEKGF